MKPRAHGLSFNLGNPTKCTELTPAELEAKTPTKTSTPAYLHESRQRLAVMAAVDLDTPEKLCAAFALYASLPAAPAGAGPATVQ